MKHEIFNTFMHICIKGMFTKIKLKNNNDSDNDNDRNFPGSQILLKSKALSYNSTQI